MARRHEPGGYMDPNGTKVWTVKFYCYSEAEQTAVIAAGLNVSPPLAFIPALSAGPPLDSPETFTGPPNCTEPMSGYAEESPGAYLAQAQHEAAIDGDGCESGACLLTRGSD